MSDRALPPLPQATESLDYERQQNLAFMLWEWRLYHEGVYLDAQARGAEPAFLAQYRGFIDWFWQDFQARLR